jgi:hypothetical protein
MLFTERVETYIIIIIIILKVMLKMNNKNWS